MECATQEMIYNKTGQYSVEGGGNALPSKAEIQTNAPGCTINNSYADNELVGISDISLQNYYPVIVLYGSFDASFNSSTVYNGGSVINTIPRAESKEQVLDVYSLTSSNGVLIISFSYLSGADSSGADYIKISNMTIDHSHILDFTNLSNDKQKYLITDTQEAGESTGFVYFTLETGLKIQLKINLHPKQHNMESTNELVTKAEASAEGLSVDSTNEYLTKVEFNANLPTPPV